MRDLKTKDPTTIVRHALIELTVAIAQSIPSDDRIIIDHVKNAAALLSVIDTEQSTAGPTGGRQAGRGRRGGHKKSPPIMPSTTTPERN